MSNVSHDTYSDLPPAMEEDNEDKTTILRGLDNLEGETISGRYKILKRIGKGGMGVVYLAQQTNLGRNVCIKVLNPALLDDSDAVGRFEREAKGLSRLQHPNIVTIFDYGRDGNLAYIVMEYAQGLTLNKFIKANAPLSLDDFLPIAVQILKGIGEAHKMGLIHRDIKPANIILSELEGEQNFVKILDFGLAKLTEGQEDLTKEQQLVGSASYMAPEQISTGHSDTRTDVYALGVLFYLMLSGRKPFTGPNDNVVLYKHVNEPAEPLFNLVTSFQNVPVQLCEVVDQCLSKDPDKRPQTANDLLNAFSYALDAPHLRAGYSSMSLNAIEPPKDFGDPSLPQMPVAKIQPENEDSSASMTTITNAVESAVTKQSVSQLTSNEIKNRRLLIILLVCIASAIIVVTIVLSSVLTSDPNTNTQETLQDDNSVAFAKIEKYIQNAEYQNAEEYLKLIKARNDHPDNDILDKITQLETDIDIGKRLLRAEAALVQEDYDKAAELYAEIIASDGNNLAARIGQIMVQAREAEKNELYEEALEHYSIILQLDKNNQEAIKRIDAIHIIPTVTINYSGDRSITKFYIDGIHKGTLPELVYLSPGHHELKVESESSQWIEEFDLDADMNITATVKLESAPSHQGGAKKHSQPAKTGSGSSFLPPKKSSKPRLL